MWSEIAEQEAWKGGRLIDWGTPSDRAISEPGTFPSETTLLEIEVTQYTVTFRGDAFVCSGTREFLGVPGEPDFPLEGDGLAIQGYGGHEFHIIKKGG